MKEAIKYILGEENGYRDELIRKLDNDKEFVEQLGRLGYITQGATMKGNSYERTWRKTKKAEDYSRVFLSELTEEEKEKGRYLHSLGF